MKANPDNSVEILHKKYYNMIEGSQKHVTQWQNTLVLTCLYLWEHLKAARVERYRCQVYHFTSTSARPCVAFLTAYKLSHMVVILFRSSSLRSCCTSLPFKRVRLLSLAQIFNRADRPLLDWKLFTNMFCTLSLTLTNKFNEAFLSLHVNSMYVNKLVKNSSKWIKVWSLSQSQFSWKITPTDKAGAVKGSQKITTHHGQHIFHEIFMKDNTEPN